MSFTRRFCRSLHTVPRLKSLQSSNLAETASFGPFSASGFTIAWTQQQQKLVNDLNVLTAGTADETRHPLAVLSMSQGDPRRQRVRNVAGSCVNNHFFMQQFGPVESNDLNAGAKTQPSRAILSRIQSKYGSLEGLKSEILEKSEEIVGQGWVYVVEESNKEIDVITLNNSGTPFDNIKLDLDLNGPISEADYLKLFQRESKVAEGMSLPLIAFSLWDVSFLHDYGVQGRRRFVEKCWDSLDWSVINERVFSL